MRKVYGAKQLLVRAKTQAKKQERKKVKRQEKREGIKLVKSQA
jgi:hypothetical protein